MTETVSDSTQHGGAMSAIALTLVIPAFAGTTSGFAMVVR